MMLGRGQVTAAMGYLLGLSIVRWVQIGTTVVSVVSAIIEWRSGRRAKSSAEATLKAAEAQFVGRLLEEYTSPEMEDALRELSKFLDKRGGADEVARFIEKGRRLHATTDAARRKVYRYFEKCYRFYNHDLLSKDALDLIVDVHGYILLFHVVKPLSEAATLPGAGPESDGWFDRLREICPPQENREVAPTLDV